MLSAALGFHLLIKYQGTAGLAGQVPQQWPAGAEISLNTSCDTLLMFVHPQCPCTRASIEELNRLMAKANGKLAAELYFIRPNALPGDWAKTGLWQSAEAIPGVSVHEDIDGAQAHLFGAETSGYVLLYDTHTNLLFHGGITESRGHAGDNEGESTIASLVAGQAVNLTQTPAFGCSLLSRLPDPMKEFFK